MSVGYNIGDMIIQLLFLIITLAPLILLIIGGIFLFRFIKRAERRSEERLEMDKENAKFQQEQALAINELNQRLTSIEKMLKEVE